MAGLGVYTLVQTILLSCYCLCTVTSVDGLVARTLSDNSPETTTMMLIGRLDALEAQVETLSNRLLESEQRNDELEILLTEEAQALSAFASRSKRQEERLSRLETAFMSKMQDELQTRRENSRARLRSSGGVDALVSRSFKEETLREFLGNREAELVALMPSHSLRFDNGASWEDDNLEGRVDLETIGRALVQMSNDNHKLTKKVEKLEDTITNSFTTTMKKQDNLSDDQIWDKMLKRVLSENKVTMMSSGEIKAESRKSAFSVASTRLQTGNNDDFTPVKFDYEFLNKGDDFNVTNSTFICEVPGYYFFTYTMRTYYNYTLAVSLVKNGEFVVALFSANGERSVTDSQSVMLELVPGDRVSLVLGPSDRYGYYSDRNRLSTFSGFLLYKKS